MDTLSYADADTFENENWIFLMFTLSRKRTHHVRNWLLAMKFVFNLQ